MNKIASSKESQCSDTGPQSFGQYALRARDVHEAMDGGGLEELTKSCLDNIPNFGSHDI